jgi:hypothetical protein
VNEVTRLCDTPHIALLLTDEYPYAYANAIVSAVMTMVDPIGLNLSSPDYGRPNNEQL